MGLASPYLPSEEKITLSVDCVIKGMHNTVSQRHLLTTNTFIVADAVSATEKYLAMGSPERPNGKAAMEKDSFPQMDNTVQALTAQSEVLITMMPKREALALGSTGAHMVPQYQQVVIPVCSYSEVAVIQSNCQVAYWLTVILLRERGATHGKELPCFTTGRGWAKQA